MVSSSDRYRVAIGRREGPASRTDGPKRVVVDLAAGDDRSELVEEVDHMADHPRLGLSSFAQQDDVVTGQDASFHRRDDGLVEADDRGKQGLLTVQFDEQVVPELLLDRPVAVAGSAELADRRGLGWGRHRFQGISISRKCSSLHQNLSEGRGKVTDVGTTAAVRAPDLARG